MREFILSNPRGNALDMENLTALKEILETAKEPLLITGEGKKFSTGLNRNQLSEELTELFDEVVGKLFHYDDVTVAFVNGDCSGGALSILAACDLRFSVPEAKFSTPAVLINRPYPPRAFRALQVALGLSACQSLIYLAQEFTSWQAKEIGLIHSIVTSNEEMRRQLALIEPGFPAIRKMKQYSRALF
ncbi:MAG: enoyl-CoA hydratase/isomerase family protein [bacterium JZ-2024 1]